MVRPCHNTISERCVCFIHQLPAHYITIDMSIGMHHHPLQTAVDDAPQTQYYRYETCSSVMFSQHFPGASNALPYIGVRFNEVQSRSTTQSDPLLPPTLHIKGPHGTPHAFRVVTSKLVRGNRKPIPPASPKQFFVPPRYWEFASPASHRGHTTWIPVA